jgi:hypothetical protein
MQLVPLRLVFGIEPFNALFADAVSSHDVIVQLAAAGFVAVVSAGGVQTTETLKHTHHHVYTQLLIRITARSC